MKLNEIKDPSDYFRGDEKNPQSPYYDDEVDDGYFDLEVTFPALLYKNGEELKVTITADVSGELVPHDMYPKQDKISFSSAVPTVVTYNGQPYNVASFISKVGVDPSDRVSLTNPKQFEQNFYDDLKAAVKNEMNY